MPGALQTLLWGQGQVLTPLRFLSLRVHGDHGLALVGVSGPGHEAARASGRYIPPVDQEKQGLMQHFVASQSIFLPYPSPNLSKLSLSTLQKTGLPGPVPYDAEKPIQEAKDVLKWLLGMCLELAV